MMLVLLMKMRESQEKEKLGFLEKRRRRREEETSARISLALPFIHRRVRNYEIPKIPLLQIKGYYILPSSKKFILEF